MENKKTFFSQNSISIATYFGGPLAAGYLIKRNYEELNEEDKGKKSLIIGIISTFIIFAGIFVVPEYIMEKIPNALIPAIYTGIIYLIVNRIQGKELKKHKELGLDFHSGWKSAGIGAIFMVILMILIAGTAFIAGDLSNSNFDTDTYDTELANFTNNESESLKVFGEFETKSPRYLITKLTSGVELWKENIKTVKRLNAIENLPEEFIQQNTILLEYCNLRIKHFNLIIKALNEETDKYADEIQNIGLSIEKKLKEL